MVFEWRYICIIMIARVGIIASSMINSSFDPDAQAFINAAGYTNSGLQTSINTLVTSLKSQSLWDKLYFLYPLATDVTGGTNTARLDQMKYNLKNTSQFTLTYFNTPTATTTGLSFNGSTQYADTNFNISSSYSGSSAHIGIYVTSNTNATVADIGASVSGYHTIFSRYTNLFYSGVLNGPTLRSSANTTGSALFIANRTTTSNHTGWRNGVSQSVEAGTQTLFRENLTVYIGAMNRQGPILYASRSYCSAFGGIGLTNAEVTTLSTIINTFQGDVETSLSLTAGTRKKY